MGGEDEEIRIQHEADEGEIVEAGLKYYERKAGEARREGRPIHRKSTETLSSRVRKSLTNKTSWYKGKRKNDTKEDGATDSMTKEKGRGEGRKTVNNKVEVEVSAPIFVPRTAGGKLKSMLMEEDNRLLKMGFSTRVKIIEEAGATLKSVLHKADHWANDPCEREECLPCRNEEKKI